MSGCFDTILSKSVKLKLTLFKYLQQINSFCNIILYYIYNREDLKITPDTTEPLGVPS